MKLLDYIFPHPCIYCGRFTNTDEFGLCNECIETLPMKLSKRTNTWYLFEYDKRISSVLKSSKYAQKPYYIRMLGGLMGRFMKEMGLSFGLVVYVPMHRKGISSRGYNQSRVAARAMAGELDAVLCDGCIKKKKRNRKQAGLGKAARRRNVKGVYKCSDSRVKGLDILLVDDIMTTGSTLNECERELRYAGAGSVTRAVIAYTPQGRNR